MIKLPFTACFLASLSNPFKKRKKKKKRNAERIGTNFRLFFFNWPLGKN